MHTVPMNAVMENQSEDDLFDLDAEVTVQTSAVTPTITSVSLCTPGCTSPNGGSFCSFCC